MTRLARVLDVIAPTAVCAIGFAVSLQLAQVGGEAWGSIGAILGLYFGVVSFLALAEWISVRRESDPIEDAQERARARAQERAEALGLSDDEGGDRR